MREVLKRRGWPVADVAWPLLAYLAVGNAVALIAGASAVSRSGLNPDSWVTLPLLFVLAIGFEEATTRAARLRQRLRSDLEHDMTSVWTIAAAVALPPGQAVVLLVAILVYIWFRQQRPAGQPLYRNWFTGSSIVLACLAAGAAGRAFEGTHSQLPWALGMTMSIGVVILVETCVNRGLVTGALLLVGVRGRRLLGTGDQNLVEFATLCLGGLLAVAIVHQPWAAVLVVVPMVTLQRGALVHELEAAASIDAKTGLLNAVTWEHLASRELARAQRGDHPVGVLIIDIDRFKMVNDRFGHLIGDAVLRSVGKCLAAEVREYDTVARFGGEEFVAVLPAADDAAALVIAERLRSRVSQLRVSALTDAGDPAEDDWLAVSIGVSSSPTDGVELSDLLHAADGALYRAKAAGRNRVMLADRGAGPERVAQG